MLLIDKPLTWTSFDAVNKIRYSIRREFNIRKIKVGHAGTLDPLATGLLIICTGKFTKRINDFMGMPKEYTGTIKLGATTPSYDLESEVDQSFPIEHITADDLEKARLTFLGEIQQVPPIFSAIRKDGKKAYDLARKGEKVELASRTVTIESFDIERISDSEISFRVVCSKGTYIRSLAHDFGQALNSGGFLSSLRRTKIGEYNVVDAQTPESFLAQLTSHKE